MSNKKSNKELRDEMTFPGALDDPRSIEEKEKDYQAEEVAAFATPDWQEKPQGQWPSYPIRDQDGSSSCVAQTLALMLGIENQREEGRYVEFSAADIYNRRSNKPLPGMIGVNGLEIACTTGATLEQFMPSQKMNEEQIHRIDRKPSDEQLGKIFKGGGYVQIPFDIERIAAFMEGNRKNGIAKPIMIWFRFHYPTEWDSEPTHKGYAPNAHHSITGLEYCIWKGKKVLIAQDSWGLHTSTLKGLRLIDQNFIEKHMTFCGTMLDLSNLWREEASPIPPDKEPEPKPKPKPDKPTHYFARTMRFGETSADVARMQDILKYEGIFPSEVSSTGRYLQITAKSVMEFQKRHNVASAQEIASLQGRVAGPKTRQTLNELYGA